MMRASILALILVARVATCLTNGENAHAKAACTALSKAVPDTVHFPNSQLYNLSNTYWSTRQSEVHPCCFITPRSTSEVSHIMKLLNVLKSPFTVKGGGHTAFPGASNIQGGVTIDLVYLNKIHVSGDRKTVSVGPGNRWINVSLVLDSLGLAVVGGRAASVGVSGLILGGGQSYFSGLYGWACDNVRNFEIVLSSGRVVNASPIVNADLYWALRGSGGSNWGVVTRFDLVAFEQGDLWMRSVLYDGKISNETLIPPMTKLASVGLRTDPGAHAYFVQTYDNASRSWLFLTSFFHAVPPGANTTPAVFDEFTSIPGMIQNNTLVANLSTISQSIDEPVGHRATWWDTTVAVTSVDLFKDIGEMYIDWVSSVRLVSGVKQFTPYLVYQPITDNILEKMQQNGGNSLGLYPQEGPFMLVQVSARWVDAELDDFIEVSVKEFISKIEWKARERNLLRGYVYMNYAGQTQDVLRTYGKKNYHRLKSIAKKWDPEEFLQRFWRGYFQLQ